MPTLDDIMDAVLKYDGGYLGGFEGTVDADPSIEDLEAARSLVSGALYDGEKLSSAYGGMYFWVGRYGDCRRADTRGYRVRYVTVYQPPKDGTFRWQFYGYGETPEIPVGSPVESVKAAVLEANLDLADVDIFEGVGGALEVHMPSRIGMGSTGGRITASGGLGVVLVSRDWSQPLIKGTRWRGSPAIPFVTMDGTGGIREAINLSLANIIVDDLYPVEVIGQQGDRDRILNPYGLAPGMTPDMVTGYFAPTDWESKILFYPPKSGVYVASLLTSVPYGPFAVPLAYNATGAQLEAALRSIGGIPSSASGGRVTVTPQGASPFYTITWRTQHHHATILPSRGTVAAVDSRKLREPYPVNLLPYWQPDSNEPALTDPGYEEGVSWFVGWRRRAHTRICPQTYPLKSDGTFDTDAEPLPGTEWLDSMTGLVNELDQTFVPLEKVVPGAFKFCLDAVAASTTGGDQARWEAAAHGATANAAAGLLYGPMTRRGNRARAGGWPTLGNKAAGYWLPD